MIPYRKPLAHGGSRLIPRAGNGQFARASIGAEVCAHCRAFILPGESFEGGFRTTTWPEKCHQCGKDWRAEGRP